MSLRAIAAMLGNLRKKIKTVMSFAFSKRFLSDYGKYDDQRGFGRGVGA